MADNAELVVKRLRSEFDGRVVAPGDPGYDRARAVRAGGIDRRPAVIVQAEDAGEVSRVVSLARDTGLPLAVRGGGHSFAGHGVNEGGIVLDLSRMRALEVDAERRTAWAGAGMTAGEYTTGVAAHGLATGFGDTGTVGIGGITLSGGVGYLSRKYGLTIDDLLAAEVVTADGQVRHVDAETHPDLFWAIRGGGGNFGVVTRFRFRLHELDTVVGGVLLLPATAEVIESFVAEARAAPDELSTIAMVMPAPPMPFVPPEYHGSLVVMAMMCYAGPPEAGERVLAPFRALATPIVDMLDQLPYPRMFEEGEEEVEPPPAAVRMVFADAVDRGTAEMIMDRLAAPDAAMRVVQLRVLGGAVARVPAEATAYAHRGSPIIATVAAMYDGADERAGRQAWVDEVAGALRGQTPGAYTGFLGDEGEARVREAYPEPTWSRLREIKRRYDPSNLFRLNQNIPPL